jgi:hypothetical protein
LSTESEQPETTEKSSKAAPKSNSGNSPVKYSIERLLAESQALVGHPTYIVAGALEGKTGDITAEAAQSAVEKFLNSEVKEG